MDRISHELRTKIMCKVKSCDTRPEILLRKALWHNGIRYRKNYKVLNCRPDIVITKYKIAVFCDGEFWHGKDGERLPATNEKYWLNKIARNKERDLENTIALRYAEWTVLRFWNKDILTNIDECSGLILSTILEIKKRKLVKAKRLK